MRRRAVNIREDVQEAIWRQPKHYFLGFKGQVAGVEKYLSADEKVLFIYGTNVKISEGQLPLEANIFKIKGKEPVLFVITDKRLIFYFKVLWNEKAEQIPLSEIRSHDIERNGLLGAALRISALTKTVVVDLEYKQEILAAIDEIVNTFRNKVARRLHDTSTSPPDKSDMLEQIERLAELHKKGILTAEEFHAKKSELLAKI